MVPRRMGLAVVTGAPGWLGTALVEALARGARFRSITTEPRPVRCIVQPGSDVPALRRLDAQIVEADLRDSRALRGACKGAELVVHAAGIIHPRRVQDLLDINLDGTRHVLDEAVASGAKRFLFVSSNSPAGLNASPAQL